MVGEGVLLCADPATHSLYGLSLDSGEEVKQLPLQVRGLGSRLTPLDGFGFQLGVSEGLLAMAAMISFPCWRQCASSDCHNIFDLLIAF